MARIYLRLDPDLATRLAVTAELRRIGFNVPEEDVDKIIFEGLEVEEE